MTAKELAENCFEKFRLGTSPLNRIAYVSLIEQAIREAVEEATRYRPCEGCKERDGIVGDLTAIIKTSEADARKAAFAECEPWMEHLKGKCAKNPLSGTPSPYCTCGLDALRSRMMDAEGGG